MTKAKNRAKFLPVFVKPIMGALGFYRQPSGPVELRYIALYLEDCLMKKRE